MAEDLLSLLKERSALLEGHFRLSSGLHSSQYLQCARVLMDPKLATKLGADLAAALRDVPGADKPGAVVAPAIGGILVAHELARALGCRALFAERQEGIMLLRRGFTLEPGESVVVAEDVITTGGSTREVIDAVRTRGAKVLAVGCVVDRSGGAAELGVPLRSLLALDIPTYPPATCPMCAKGSRPEMPGSRIPSGR
jgi:orotate phosphoribosyltransferase